MSPCLLNCFDRQCDRLQEPHRLGSIASPIVNVMKAFLLNVHVLKRLRLYSGHVISSLHYGFFFCIKPGMTEQFDSLDLDCVMESPAAAES